VQKEVWWVDHPNVCTPKSGWLIDLPKGNGGKEKGNLLCIKGLNKGEKLRQLAFCRLKFLKDSYLGNGVEGICDIHL
jgi:hypothetical protein